MAQSLISIIITCYNQQEYIDETIESVLKLKYKNWECLIIDDGSTDQTRQKITPYLTDKRIRYIHQKNQGVSCARNRGIDNAIGDYILFLDGDDKLAENALEDLLIPFKDNPQLLISYSDCQTFGTENTTSSLSNAFSLRDILRRNKVFITNLIRREDLGKDIRFEETISGKDEDWEFWIHLVSKFPERECRKIKSIAFFYRKHYGSNMQRLKINKEVRKEGFVFVYLKYHHLYHQYFPDYITLLNRNEFYEKKLERIYNSRIYKLLSPFSNLLK